MERLRAENEGLKSGSYMAMKGRAEQAEARLRDVEDVLRRAVAAALDSWLYRSDTSDRSYLMGRDEAAVADDVVRYCYAALIDGSGCAP
jgi:hypothetical protein